MLVSVERKKKQEKEGIKFWDWGGQKVTFFSFDSVARKDLIKKLTFELTLKEGVKEAIKTRLGVEKYSRQPVPRSYGQEYWHAPGTKIRCG